MKPRTHYILVNGKMRPAELLEWARWFETAERIIEKTRINADVEVSTVFLGLDHRFGGDGPPILFETMVFGGPRDQHMKRYSTYGDAKRGHFEVVEECRMTTT